MRSMSSARARTLRSPRAAARAAAISVISGATSESTTSATSGAAARPSPPQRIQTEFHATQRRVVQSLHDKGALRRGLGVDRGADIMWTLNHPDVWHLLVGARGWSPEEYERWFADTLCAQLLRSER